MLIRFKNVLRTRFNKLYRINCLMWSEACSQKKTSVIHPHFVFFFRFISNAFIVKIKIHIFNIFCRVISIILCELVDTNKICGKMKHVSSIDLLKSMISLLSRKYFQQDTLYTSHRPVTNNKFIFLLLKKKSLACH